MNTIDAHYDVVIVGAGVGGGAMANRLAHAVLGTTLDELPPQTRRLLVLVRAWAKAPSRARTRSRAASCEWSRIRSRMPPLLSSTNLARSAWLEFMAPPWSRSRLRAIADATA